MNRKYAAFVLEGIILISLCSLNRDILIAYLWIILHEFAHIIVARLYKIDVKKLDFRITGVSCKFSDFESLENNKKIVLYISGPMFNLISALVLFILNKYFILNNNEISKMMYINLALFIFNMVPAYPLDGCRIYEALMLKKLFYKKVRNILLKVSFAVGVSFAFLFIMSLYIHKINFGFLISSILIVFTTITEKRKTSFILMKDIILKKIIIDKKQILENKSFSVCDKCTLCKAFSALDKNKFNYIYILDEKLKLERIISETELIEAIKKYGNITFNEYIIKPDKETILK